MNAIKEKAMIINGYAEVMEKLEGLERWYQHTEEDDPEKWIDDEYPEAKATLCAIRETMKAVKKLAGV